MIYDREAIPMMELTLVVIVGLLPEMVKPFGNVNKLYDSYELLYLYPHHLDFGHRLVKLILVNSLVQVIRDKLLNLDIRATTPFEVILFPHLIQLASCYRGTSPLPTGWFESSSVSLKIWKILYGLFAWKPW